MKMLTRVLGLLALLRSVSGGLGPLRRAPQIARGFGRRIHSGASAVVGFSWSGAADYDDDNGTDTADAPAPDFEDIYAFARNASLIYYSTRKLL